MKNNSKGHHAKERDEMDATEDNELNTGQDVQNPAANQTMEEYDRLSEEADKERARKPGSQSNSGDRHNNGRGGGK